MEDIIFFFLLFFSTTLVVFFNSQEKKRLVGRLLKSDKSVLEEDRSKKQITRLSSHETRVLPPAGGPGCS
jgi:hypothetical protein